MTKRIIERLRQGILKFLVYMILWLVVIPAIAVLTCFLALSILFPPRRRKSSVTHEQIGSPVGPTSRPVS